MTIQEILGKHPGLERELRTFHRELPKLLASGGDGKFVVVKGDRASEPWDSYGEAMQSGLRQFDSGEFLIQRIDPRLGPMLTVAFGPIPVPEPASCPV